MLTTHGAVGRRAGSGNGVGRHAPCVLVGNTGSRRPASADEETPGVCQAPLPAPLTLWRASEARARGRVRAFGSLISRVASVIRLRREPSKFRLRLSNFY